jgi:hypothetical protein
LAGREITRGDAGGHRQSVDLLALSEFGNVGPRIMMNSASRVRSVRVDRTIGSLLGD